MNSIPPGVADSGLHLVVGGRAALHEPAVGSGGVIDGPEDEEDDAEGLDDVTADAAVAASDPDAPVTDPEDTEPAG
jgi:hypothetical protein